MIYEISSLDAIKALLSGIIRRLSAIQDGLVAPALVAICRIPRVMRLRIRGVFLIQCCQIQQWDSQPMGMKRE
jgi:hypothetical protein